MGISLKRHHRQARKAVLFCTLCISPLFPAVALAATDITSQLTANGGTNNITLAGAAYSVSTTSGSPITYSGILSGTGTVEAMGTGTLVLNNINTYTLPTVTETVSELFISSTNKQFASYEGYTTQFSPALSNGDNGGFNGPIYTLHDGSSNQPDPPAFTIDPGVDVQFGTNADLHLGNGPVTLGNLTNPTTSNVNLDNVLDNGTLTFQGSNSFSQTQTVGQISGTGAVIVQAGIMQLYNANTFSGPLLIENNMTLILGSDHITASIPNAATVFNNGTFILDTPFNTPTNQPMIITQNIYENHFGNDINVNGFGGPVVFASVNTYTDNSSNTNNPPSQMNPTLSNPNDNFNNELNVIDNRRGLNIGISSGTGSTNPSGGIVQLGNGTTTNFFLPGNPLTTYISLEQNSILSLDYSNTGPTYVNTIIAGGPTGTSDVQESLATPGTGTVIFHQGQIVVTQQQYYDGVTQIDSGATLQLGDGTTGDTQTTTSGEISFQTSGGDGDLLQSGQTVTVADTTGKAGHSSTSIGTSANQIINNGTIVVDNTKATLLSNLSGTGKLIQAGAGTTMLGPAISFTGATTIAGGTLSVAPGASLVSSSGITISSSGRAALVASPYSSTNTNFVAVPAPVLDLSQSGNQTLQNLTGDSTGAIHLGNNTLTLQSSTATTFGGKITDGGAGASLIKSGPASLTLTNINSYTGGTTVSAGGLIVGSTGALPTGAVNITGGTLQLAPSTGLATLTSLSISGSGTFDVNNNQVIINYGSSPDPISSIAALLATGYNNGSWNGPGGIDTSAPLIVSGLTYGLGYADGADSQHLATGLSSGTIEIKYTLLGDADLNGIVNGLDFGILAANFNKGITGWDEGDFDYNGIVNGLDFADLAANFNKGAAGVNAVAALDAFANGLTVDLPVPEPASSAILLTALGCLTARRRRR